MMDLAAWVGVILGLIIGWTVIKEENRQMRSLSHRYGYDDNVEDNFMKDLEEWILVEDLEEELEDDGYFDDEE